MNVSRETLAEMTKELDPKVVEEILSMCANEKEIPSGEDDLYSRKSLQRIGDYDIPDSESFPPWRKVPIVLLNGKAQDEDLSDPFYSSWQHQLGFT